MFDQLDSLMWGLLVILIIFSALIGKNQMIRIVVGNYILMIVALSLDGAVDMWTWGVNSVNFGDTRNLSRFFSEGRVTITLIIYAILLALIFKKSTLHSSHPGILGTGFLLLLVPMTVVSLALTLGVIFLGTSVFDPGAMSGIASSISGDATIQGFIKKVPLWIFVHGILTILLTTHLSLSYFFKKTPQIADTDDFLGM